MKISGTSVTCRSMALVLLVVMVLLTGCTRVSQKAGDLWEGITIERKEEKGETRDEAIRRLGYNGKKDEIILDTPQIKPSTVSRGGKVRQELRYTVLSPDAGKSFTVTEVIVMSGEGLQLELARSEKERAQGGHVSSFQFALPRDIMPGEYQLITSVISGKESRKATAKFKVKR